MNILQKIVNHKKQELVIQKDKHPLSSFINDLQPSQRDFKQAISQKKNQLNLIAELKKASPSMGVINKDFKIAKIIKIYNQYASAISVLTDEQFFGGKLDYLKRVRRISNLPLLRKDFIIDPYQIYEARWAGADAVLLIAGILSVKQIDEFIKIAKQYKMDCLVEVHNLAELKKVLLTKAEIIGINNRSLKTFKIDLKTTLKLAKNIPKNKIIVSESGIVDFNDIIKLNNQVSAVLVGTALMKEKNIAEAIKKLLWPQVKICGLKNLVSAQTAVKSGANLLGFVFVKGRRRYIEPEQAKIIIKKIRTKFPKIKIVGVWQNEELSVVNKIAQDLALDFVQLHGAESPAYVAKIIKPVIKAISIDKKFNPSTSSGYNILNKYKTNITYFLLDTLDGGRGKTFDWQLAKNLSQKYPIILSGGLNAQNVQRGIKAVQPQVVDVSSGVENVRGDKDLDKIRVFINKVVA